MLEFIIKRKIKKLSERKRVSEYRGLNELQSILVLFDTVDYEYADSFLEKLKRMNKVAKGCGYRSQETNEVYSKNTSFIIIPNVDTNKRGIPELRLLNTLEETKYDAIIDLTLNENYTLEYILAYLDTPLKIGFKKNDLPMYDFVITKLPESKDEKITSVAQLGDVIFYYLSQIRSDIRV